MKPENTKKLEEIFRIVLEVPDGESVTGLRRVAVRRWDSLVHTSLVAAVESEFGVRLDAKAIDRFTSYAAVEALLEELGY